MQMDWSNSTIRNPEQRKELEKELKEWIEESDRDAIENNLPPLSPNSARLQFESFSRILTTNELDAPILVDDFGYTDEELKACCLQFPCEVRLRGDILHRYSTTYFKKKHPGLPWDKVPRSAFEKIQKEMEKHWKKHRAKFDELRTDEEYVKYRQMWRGRFHCFNRRDWIKKQRAQANRALIEVNVSEYPEYSNEVIVCISDGEQDSCSEESDLHATVISSQKYIMDPPSQVLVRDELSEDFSTYTAFSQNLANKEKSTQMSNELN